LIGRTKRADHVNKSITAAGITITLISRAIVIAHIADSDAQTYGVGSINGAAIVVIQNIKERPLGDSQTAAIRLTVALTISRSTETISTYVGGAFIRAIRLGIMTHAAVAIAIIRTTGFRLTAEPAAAVTIITTTILTVSNAVSLTSAVAETSRTSGA